MRSDDIGFTWTKVHTKVDSLDPSLIVSSVDFLEGSFGIAVASDHSWAPRSSYALLTRDSGATWACSSLPDSLHATFASIPDENVALVGGTNWRHGSFGTGFTARTTDRGESWTVTEMASPVSSLHFSTALIGACGTFDGLYRTTNGGATWSKHTNITQQNTVEDIWFGGSFEGYATIGMEVFETTNGGATWYPYLGIPSISGAQGVAMSRSRDFFVSTQNGGFLSSKNSTVISAARGRESEVPRTTFLQQNFPNPFNGQTNIPFTLDRTRSVRVAVFDLLGREVAVLAEGEFGGGSHSVVWNSGNRAAGVYWIALTAGSHRDVRKILLLR